MSLTFLDDLDRHLAQDRATEYESAHFNPTSLSEITPQNDHDSTSPEHTTSTPILTFISRKRIKAINDLAISSTRIPNTTLTKTDISSVYNPTASDTINNPSNFADMGDGEQSGLGGVKRGPNKEAMDNSDENQKSSLSFSTASSHTQRRELNTNLIKYTKLNSFEDLPIFQLRPNFLKLLRNNIVILLCLGTGFGKSTQIPQYIVEDIASRSNTPQRIWMTVPRQHVAKSLVQRIGQELNFKREMKRLELEDEEDWDQNDEKNHTNSNQRISPSNAFDTELITKVTPFIPYYHYNSPVDDEIDIQNDHHDLAIVQDVEAAEAIAHYINRLQNFISQNDTFDGVDMKNDQNDQNEQKNNKNNPQIDFTTLPFTTLIIDEFHDRTIPTDLLLSLFLRYYSLLQLIQHPLVHLIRVVIMSATLSVSGLFSYLKYNLNIDMTNKFIKYRSTQSTQHFSNFSNFPARHSKENEDIDILNPVHVITATNLLIGNDDDDNKDDTQMNQNENQSQSDDKQNSRMLQQELKKNTTFHPISTSTIYPVTIHYQDELNYDYINAAAQQCFDIHLNKPIGDVIVFLPHEKAIMKTESAFLTILQNYLNSNQHISVISNDEYDTLYKKQCNMELEQFKAAKILGKAKKGELGSESNDLNNAKNNQEETETDFVLPTVLNTLPYDKIYDFISVKINANSINNPNIMDQIYAKTDITTRKIIFSTEICETSITIPNVVYVIDSGFQKTFVNNINDCSDLPLTSIISKSQAIQRCGRAGRCRPGMCFRLYTKKNLRNFLVQNVPEIQRCNVVFLLLFLTKHSISYYNCLLLQPPPSFIINSSYQLLLFYDLLTIGSNQGSKIGGLTFRTFQTFTITPYGQLLYSLIKPSRLPSPTPSQSAQSAQSTTNHHYQPESQLSFHFARMLISSRYLSIECSLLTTVIISYLLLLQEHFKAESEDGEGDQSAADIFTTQFDSKERAKAIPSQLQMLSCGGNCQTCSDGLVSCHGDIMTVLNCFIFYQNEMNNFQSIHNKSHSFIPKSKKFPHINFELFHKVQQKRLELLQNPLISSWYPLPLTPENLLTTPLHTITSFLHPSGRTNLPTATAPGVSIVAPTTTRTGRKSRWEHVDDQPLPPPPPLPLHDDKRERDRHYHGHNDDEPRPNTRESGSSYDGDPRQRDERSGDHRDDGRRGYGSRHDDSRRDNRDRDRYRDDRRDKDERFDDRRGNNRDRKDRRDDSDVGKNYDNGRDRGDRRDDRRIRDGPNDRYRSDDRSNESNKLYDERDYDDRHDERHDERRDDRYRDGTHGKRRDHGDRLHYERKERIDRDGDAKGVDKKVENQDQVVKNETNASQIEPVPTTVSSPVGYTPYTLPTHLSNQLTPLQDRFYQFFRDADSVQIFSNKNTLADINTLSIFDQIRYVFMMCFSKQSVLQIPQNSNSNSVNSKGNTNNEGENPRQNAQKFVPKYELRLLSNIQSKVYPSISTNTQLVFKSGMYQLEQRMSDGDKNEKDKLLPSIFTYYSLGMNNRINHLLSFTYKWLSPWVTLLQKYQSLHVLTTMFFDAKNENEFLKKRAHKLTEKVNSCVEIPDKIATNMETHPVEEAPLSIKPPAKLSFKERLELAKEKYKMRR